MPFAVILKPIMDTSPEVDHLVESVARQGATPLVVAEGASVLGVIALKDIVKGGIKSVSPRCVRWALKR